MTFSYGVDEKVGPVEDGPRELLVRVEAALRTLGEGRAKATGGLEAVGDLRRRLGELAVGLNIDLREVQESVVENAAMYANCPEVLGGMLQLVFCLDLVRAWFSEQQSRSHSLEQRVNDVENNLSECDALLEGVANETRICAERVATLEIAADFGRAIRFADGRPRHDSGCQESLTSTLRHNRSSPTASERLSVDLRELDEDYDGMSPSVRTMVNSEIRMGMEMQDASEVVRALDEANAALEGMRHENGNLRSELEAAEANAPSVSSLAAMEKLMMENNELRAHAEAARASHRAPAVALEELRRENSTLRTQLAAVSAAATAAAAGKASPTPRPSPRPGAPPSEGLLSTLELLEPLLAALPVGVVPGMCELQEEACEAYARLRSLLLEVVAAPLPQVNMVPGKMVPGSIGEKPGPSNCVVQYPAAHKPVHCPSAPHMGEPIAVPPSSRVTAHPVTLAWDTRSSGHTVCPNRLG